MVNPSSVLWDVCISYNSRMYFSRTWKPFLWNVILKKGRAFVSPSIGGQNPKFNNCQLTDTISLMAFTKAFKFFTSLMLDRSLAIPPPNFLILGGDTCRSVLLNESSLREEKKKMGERKAEGERGRTVEESQRKKSKERHRRGNWNRCHSLIRKLKNWKLNYMSHLKLYIQLPLKSAGKEKMES